MCSLLQLYQYRVISDQNLTSVSSTQSHNFSHGTNMPMAKNALLPGENIPTGFILLFFGREGALMTGCTGCLWSVTHSVNS